MNDSTIKKVFLVFYMIFLFLFTPLLRAERVYPVVPKLNVRKSASPTAPVITRLRHGRWVEVVSQNNDKQWLQIKLPNGKKGFVSADKTNDYWIKVLKAERKLVLMKDTKEEQVFPMALGFNPTDDKIKLGDGCTPEGRFYICEIKKFPKPSPSYGHVSLRISYPTIEDARRGLQTKIITRTQYLAIVSAINKGIMPPQNTKLGSSIKIHGGDYGVDSDWTLGCMALKNKDMNTLSARLPHKYTLVDIYKSKKQYQQFANTEYVNRQTLKGAQVLLRKGCTYTNKARSIIPLKYPMGDFDSSQGVCTDVVIRALRRGVGIDLQALLYEDITVNGSHYRSIKRPNPNIDHRRTRNLKIFFDHHAQTLTNKTPRRYPQQWKAGDIVLMDTGISNGTIYDHIGIVSSNRHANGDPLVINLWATGSTLNEMELLNGGYPTIVGHYRLFHPLYYTQ